MGLRENNIQRLESREFDVLILGGGINGAVSAASMAARGLSVALVDQGDFGGDISSNSSNLAWGGIKYLESFEFLLVNKLCKSRNNLMEHYPSTVKEIRFLTTIQKGFRYPALLVFLGTILYWVMGRFQTRPPGLWSVRRINRDEPVIDTSAATGGFEYSDCYLYDNDARFVFNFIRSAMNYGCIAANYVESLGSTRTSGSWLTRMKDGITGREFTVGSRALVNACGSHVDAHNRLTGQETDHEHLFSKGIHLIVDQITTSHKVLTFFASDGRLFFVVPMGPKTCLGTTDTRVEVPEVEVTDEDRDFVLNNVNALLNLARPLTKKDIVAERCGVRPLAVEDRDDASDWVQLSRKHAIDVNKADQHLSIFGGKLTDCLNVGEEVTDIIEGLGIEIPFPGKKWFGEPHRAVREDFMHRAQLMDLDSLTDKSSSEPLSQRLWRRYGEKALAMLEDIREDPSQADLLIENAEYIRCEIVEAAKSEMITKLDDFLRRRSKISQVVRHEDIVTASGLREACEIFFGAEAEQQLNDYIGSVEGTPGQAHT